MNIGHRTISRTQPPYLIAEACNNFNNDMSLAEDMIGEAKQAGCDAIKYQMRLQPGRLTPDQHFELMGIAEQAGIEYLCTPFTEEAIGILGSMNVRAYKVGSGQARDEKFLREVCKLGKPIFISTGGCTMDDVAKIVGLADECTAHQGYVLMQCTSIYPTPYDRADIGVLENYKLMTPLAGLSDHTNTIYTSIGAVALGAVAIEKHFTLSHSYPGPDQSSSLEPQELREWVLACNAMWRAMGEQKTVYPEELQKLASVRP